MTKKNIRSEYVKNLLAEKDNLGAMLSESTSEAIKSYLGESVNKGLRNILSEAEDSFTEEEVDDATPKLKKNSKKDAEKDSKKSTKKGKSEKPTEKSEKEDEEEEVTVDITDDEGNDDGSDDDDNFDYEDDEEFDIEDNDDFESDDDEGNDTDDDDFDSENDFEGEDDFDDNSDMESGDYDDGSEDEVWNSVEQFMGEDGEYDLTGQDKDTVMKVLKVMKPEDGVRIVQKGDGMYELDDENNDVEYVISLNENEIGDEDEMDVENDYTFDDNGDLEDVHSEEDFFDDEGDEFERSEDFDVEDIPNEDGFGSEDYDFDENGDELDDEFDPMDDECCLNEDDLGYDPHYGQNKTAMTMPSDSDDDNGSKIKMNAGLPKGSKNNGQRWVGNTNGKMAPYSNKTETLYEVELEEDDLNTDTTFNNNSTSMPSTNEASTVANGAHTKGLVGSSPKNRVDNNRAPHKSGAKKSNENFERKVKAIMAENKELRKIATEIKKRLEENVVVNASLGKIIKLMVENSTTKDEKVNILNRFNKVKSVKESKELYESISSELKRSHKNNNSPMVGAQITEAKKTGQQIVENRLNESSDVKAMRDFIERLDRI